MQFICSEMLEMCRLMLVCLRTVQKSVLKSALKNGISLYVMLRALFSINSSPFSCLWRHVTENYSAFWPIGCPYDPSHFIKWWRWIYYIKKTLWNCCVSKKDFRKATNASLFFSSNLGGIRKWIYFHSIYERFTLKSFFSPTWYKVQICLHILSLFQSLSERRSFFRERKKSAAQFFKTERKKWVSASAKLRSL